MESKAEKLFDKAADYYIENELLLAERYAKKAYQVAIDVSQPIVIADILHNMAVFYWLRKAFETSIDYFKKSIKINSNIGEPNKLANSINGLGYVYRGIGDYQNALNSFNHAVEISIKNNSENLAPYYFDLARTQKITNKTKDAFQTYKKGIIVAQSMIAESKHELHKFYEQIIYNCYNDLSEIELINSNLPQANHFHQKALQVLENSKSNVNTFFEAYKRFEIPAKILMVQKDFNQAIQLFDKAERAIIEEYQGFEVGKDLANIIHQIGDCYLQLNEYEKALETYQRAIKAVCNQFCCDRIESLPGIEEIYNKRSVIESLSYKASTWLKLYGQKQQYLLRALETYQLIAQLLPLTRKDYVEENSKFQLAEETKGIFQKAIDTCILLEQLTNDQKYKKLAFQFAESAKAIVLQEHIQANHAIKGVDEPIQQKDMDLRSKIAFYQNAINTHQTTQGDEKQMEKWQAELFQCKEQYEAFQKEIESQYPQYYAIKYANNLTNVETLQKKLPHNSALIEYFLGEDNPYGFVITHNSFEVHHLQVCYKELKKEIGAFKKLVEYLNTFGCEKEFDDFKKMAHCLYKKLLHQSLQNLPNTICRLMIVPDDLLFNFPFEALLISEKEHFPTAGYQIKNLDYLFKHYALSYDYSASLLLKTTEVKPQSYHKNFIGFAPEFEDLLNNQEEVQNIHVQLAGDIYLKEQAHFEHFKQHASSSKIIHLSTHAKQNQHNHKLSEIQFADATITNYHIENMQINAGLAVLSACETGSGFIQSGEGAMSLARSFFLAGCPSLVSSLWLADDESTTEIMLYFYQHLKAGEAKDVALQKAKLQYCADAGIRESHPFYWAGFVQSGNRRELF